MFYYYYKTTKHLCRVLTTSRTSASLVRTAVRTLDFLQRPGKRETPPPPHHMLHKYSLVDTSPLSLSILSRINWWTSSTVDEAVYGKERLNNGETSAKFMHVLLVKAFAVDNCFNASEALSWNKEYTGSLYLSCPLIIWLMALLLIS